MDPGLHGNRDDALREKSIEHRFQERNAKSSIATLVEGGERTPGTVSSSEKRSAHPTIHTVKFRQTFDPEGSLISFTTQAFGKDHSSQGSFPQSGQSSIGGNTA